MATQRGPKIVRNGLIRCWDAADYKTIIANRINFLELTGSGDSVRQNNDPGSGSTWGGYWYFNGVTSVTIMNLPVCGTAYTGARTAEVWMNSQQSNSADTNFRGFFRFGDTTTSNGFSMALRGTTELGFNQGNWVNAGDTTWRTISQSIYNRWLLFTLSYTPSTLTWYVNGQSIHSQTITLSSGIQANNNISLAGYGNFTPILIGAVRYYNIGLTASQVLQNFNAQRARFGI